MRISDDDLYEWKAVRRPAVSRVDQLSVQPAGEQKLLLGSLAVTGPGGVRAVEVSENNFLSFATRDGDLMFLNMAIADADQRPLLSVIDNVVRYKDDRISFDSRPGRVCVTAELSAGILPFWLPGAMRQKHPSCLVDGRVLVTDLKVLEPALVSFEGILAEADQAVVVSDDALTFFPAPGPGLTLAGGGKETVLHYGGDINTAFFRMLATGGFSSASASG